MRKKILFIAGLVFLSVAKAHAYDNHDLQVWNTDVQEFKVAPGWKMTLEEEFRWGNNASEFYYHHYDLGYSHDIGKHFNFGAGYRQVFEKKSGGFTQENEPYGTASVLWDLAGFRFEDRNRLEYRAFVYQEDQWRYRNKLTMKFPWKFTKMAIQPYVSDEVFVMFKAISQFNENRFSSGLAFNLTKNIKAEIYYMLRSTKGTDRWTDTNVLGTKLKIVF